MLKVLTITPILSGNSFMIIESLLKHLSKSEYAKIRVIGMGKHEKNSLFSMTAIPYTNILYQIPMQLIFLVNIFMYRPNIVISDGVNLLYISIIFLKLLSIPVVVYYSSGNRIPVKVLDFFASRLLADNIVHKKNMSLKIDPNKIFVVNLVSDFKPVLNSVRKVYRRKYHINDDDILLVYIGDLVHNDELNSLLDFIHRLEESNKQKVLRSKNVKIIIAGEGPVKDDVMNKIAGKSFVKYIGVLSKRSDIKTLLLIADISLVPSHKDYLSKLAVDSLTVGTPIFLSKGHIPENIGFTLNGSSLESILAKDDLLSKMRVNCIKYAYFNYNSKNLDSAVKAIRALA